MTVLELKEARAKLVANARQIIDAADKDERSLNQDEQNQVDAMFADADKLAEQAATAERKERLEKDEAELRQTTGRKTVSTSKFDNISDAERKAAIRNWCLYGTGKGDNSADALYRAAQSGVVLSANTLEVRALAKSSSTVPVGFANEVSRALKYYCPIRSIARTLNTETGQDIVWPKVSDVANVASIVDEAGSIGSSTDPTFTAVTLKAFKWASPIVKVSLELLQDNAVDIEALLADLFGERMGRGQEAAFMTGDGTTGPQGLVTGATAGVNLASGNAVTFDKIIDLIHSVDRAYRANGSFLMHDSTLAACRKVKDDNLRYIWEPSAQVGEPDRLFGYPVYVSNSFAEYVGNEGDNKPLILFGDFKHYLIRDVSSSLAVAKLDQLYAANGQIGFVMLMRTDGRYIGHSGCVKSLNSYDS